MKANAPGGETTGQVRKAFTRSVFGVGTSMVTLPQAQGEPANRRQVSHPASDGLSSRSDPKRHVQNFQSSHTGGLQTVTRQSAMLQSGVLIRGCGGHFPYQYFQIPLPHRPRGPGLGW